MLSELEHDALTELVNVAVSGAAVRLRAMVGAEVRLTVPAILVLDGADAIAAMTDLGLAHLTAVRQSFTGKLLGETLLIFPGDHHQALVRAILGEGMSDEEVAALVEDAVGEIGNVLLLGFLSTIGQMLSVTFEVSLPAVIAAEPSDLFPPANKAVALFIYVNFTIAGRDVRGYFAMVLGLETFLILRGLLQAFIAQMI